MENVDKNPVQNLDLYTLVCYILTDDNIKKVCKSLQGQVKHKKVIVPVEHIHIDANLVKNRLIEFIKLPYFRTKPFILRRICIEIKAYIDSLRHFTNMLQRMYDKEGENLDYLIGTLDNIQKVNDETY